MRWRYVFTLLRTVKIPGFLPLLKDWQALVRWYFLYAALECGLLRALRTPLSKDDLIRQLKVSRPDLLEALLDVGLACKELVREDGKFSITGKRARALLGKDGDMLSAMVQANVTYYHSAYFRAAQRLPGGPLGEDLAEIGDLVARFSKIGEPIIKQFLIGLIPKKGSLHVLDVGCGAGIYLRLIQKVLPNATGIGVDADGAASEQARGNLEAWGIADRFHIVTGDIRRPPEPLKGPFDLIMLLNIFYYFPLEERPGLLERLRSLLSDRGTIALAMNFHGRGRDLAAAHLNLVNCSLKGLTPLPDLEETKSLLRAAGFIQIKIENLIPGSAYFGIAAKRG
jgi:4-hydroxy-2,2'-bipyrrole-5-carbaldehyde O-methyltransferase